MEGGLNRGAPATCEELIAICRAFLDKMRSGTAPWVVQRLNHTYGPEPVDNPSNFSFWMALVRAPFRPSMLHPLFITDALILGNRFYPLMNMKRPSFYRYALLDYVSGS